jgi:Domain of unknown function (DUF1851)
MGAEDRGLVLASGQIYDYTVAPALGGELGLDNVQTIDFVVGVNIAGQLHRQIKDLPPGTSISGVELVDE